MKFKTHEDLKITFSVWASLLATRTMLAEGLIEHDPEVSLCNVPTNKHVFNMNHAGAVNQCGSVSCIGGTMAIAMGIRDEAEIAQFVQDPPSLALRKLFYPCDDLDMRMEMDEITPEQAVQAIDQYLTKGFPDWRSVLGEAAYAGFSDEPEGPTPEDKEAIAQRYGMDAGQMQDLIDKFNPDKNG